MESENIDMGKLREYAKDSLASENSRKTDGILDEMKEVLDTLAENSGKKIIVDVLVAALKSGISEIAHRYRMLEEKQKITMGRLNKTTALKFQQVTDHDKEKNELLKMPCSNSLFPKSDKDLNDKFMEQLFESGKDIEGFDEMTDVQKAFAVLERESNKQTKAAETAAETSRTKPETPKKSRRGRKKGTK